jgi:preprotein translocase subunit SecD
MLNVPTWKVVLVILVSLMGVLYAAPNLLAPQQLVALQERVPSWLPSKTINLGLDLRGGSHLLYEADMKKVLSKHMETLKNDTRLKLRGGGGSDRILYDGLVEKRDGITFKLKNPEKDAAEARKIVHGLAENATIDVSPEGVVNVTLDEKAIKQIQTQIIDQAIEVVRRRVDATGTKEPVIQRQGSDRIVIQLPGVSDPSHVKELIGQTAQMSFHLMDEDAMARGQPGFGSLKVGLREHPAVQVFVQKTAVLDGKRLTDAQPSFDQNGNAVVSFRFDSIGAKIFCDITRENVGKPFAILMDKPQKDKQALDEKEVITYPNINEPICSGSGQISGNFTVQEATDLALLLRSGALPASLSVVEERSVGPTLGSDSVAAGKLAAVAAFIAVVILMVAFYGLFGVFADIALTLNMIFIFALLSMLQATLTLPGIAGIILTIGIAVDSNVLIYERIREELRSGRSVLSSVDKGYEHALRTIFDSNLTTLIVALILFSFGSGPVKGFAVAMSIGIITSLFSSIMITRLIIIAWLRRTRPTALAL